MNGRKVLNFFQWTYRNQTTAKHIISINPLWPYAGQTSQAKLPLPQGQDAEPAGVP